MIAFLLLPLLLQSPAEPTVDPLQVSAWSEAIAYEVGPTYEIQLLVRPGPRATLSEAGLPAPILQVDPPAGVELEGPVLTELQDLARNKLLQHPFERLIQARPTVIGFRLTGEPDEGATIGLNVLAYVRVDGKPARFVRRRLELPLVSGATATAGDPADSTWGVDAGLLQIGSPAAAFELPRADGTKVSLAGLLEDGDVLVTTYRAHW